MPESGAAVHVRGCWGVGPVCGPRGCALRCALCAVGGGGCGSWRCSGASTGTCVSRISDLGAAPRCTSLRRTIHTCPPPRDALDAPPPPSRAPSLCPATVWRQVLASMAFVTASTRPQPLWQPPPTAWLTASGAVHVVVGGVTGLPPHSPAAIDLDVWHAPRTVRAGDRRVNGPAFRCRQRCAFKCSGRGCFLVCAVGPVSGPRCAPPPPPPPSKKKYSRLTGIRMCSHGPVYSHSHESKPDIRFVDAAVGWVTSGCRCMGPVPTGIRMVSGCDGRGLAGPRLWSPGAPAAAAAAGVLVLATGAANAGHGPNGVPSGAWLLLPPAFHSHKVGGK